MSKYLQYGLIAVAVFIAYKFLVGRSGGVGV